MAKKPAETCKKCDGAKFFVQRVNRHLPGTTERRHCPRCEGTGKEPGRSFTGRKILKR